ncbi:MAG: DUF4404 family protein [Chloroflexi bacterium CFX2]|nr:DUF4404 family protein [Chloroflexi bacterium CFX2]
MSPFRRWIKLYNKIKRTSESKGASMNDRKLDALLEKVHNELQKVEKIDAENLRLLQDLEQDVQALLKRSEVETPSILARIRKAVDRFEIEHPTLTALLSEVSTILSNAGI